MQRAKFFEIVSHPGEETGIYSLLTLDKFSFVNENLKVKSIKEAKWHLQQRIIVLTY